MMKHQPRKRFGQHFLKDDHVINHIIHSLSLNDSNHVVEIGPGKGALTETLTRLVQKLDLIEIDHDLIEILQRKFTENTHVTIHQADVLKFNFQDIYTHPIPLRVIGNLPYNISTPLLFHLFSFLNIIDDMHFMLQKEVVDRLTAQPGTSAYGRLSVITQYHCQANAYFDVPPNAFYPPPKVMSAIVRLKPFEKLPHVANNYPLFSEIVRTAFQHKRKTLQNNLRAYLEPKDFIALNINPQRRAETLSVFEFVNISNWIDR